MTLKLFFDGGYRPNRGMEAAVVARGRLYFAPALGEGSSERAEWLALLRALSVAEDLAGDDIILLGDSLSIVRQANGVQKPKGAELRSCLLRFQEAARRFARVRVRHVRRTQNLAGIALTKLRAESRGTATVKDRPE